MIFEEISRLTSLCDELKSTDKPIFLYGMGNGAEKIHSYLKENQIEIKGVVASDGFVRGQSFLGFNVRSISDAESEHGSLCLVTCFGLEGERSRFLYELKKSHKIISPNLPVFGEGVCDKRFILQNIEKFERVYELLADDKSKELFLAILKYNVTGDISYLQIENSEEPPEEFFNQGERHIDIGAYDGDTVEDFVSRSDYYSDIIAFEPDHITFRKLKKNTSGFRDIIPENCAVGRTNGEIAFASGGGRASHSGEGDEKVKCVSVDNYCGFTHIAANGTKVGSIKIDAEGMDEEVICGAVNTIYCCKSALCVALYHRAADLVELPLLIRKHNSRYKFYLRKKEYIPAWDIFLYAIHEEKE